MNSVFVQRLVIYFPSR